MEGVGWTEGVQEEGARERRGENRRNESGEFERRGAKGGEGRNEANGVNLPGCRGSPSPLRPPEGTLLLLLFIFLLRRTGCVSRDKIYPASFPPLRDRVAGGREAMRPTPATRCRLTLSLCLSLSHLRVQAKRRSCPGSRSVFLDFFEYFSMAFSVNSA